MDSQVPKCKQYSKKVQLISEAGFISCYGFYGNSSFTGTIYIHIIEVFSRHLQDQRYQISSYREDA